MTSNSAKTPDYSPWFSARNWIWVKKITMEMLFQGEQNDTNFSFTAPSTPDYWPKTEMFDFGKKAKKDVSRETEWCKLHFRSTFQ